VPDTCRPPSPSAPARTGGRTRRRRHRESSWVLAATVVLFLCVTVWVTRDVENGPGNGALPSSETSETFAPTAAGTTVTATAAQLLDRLPTTERYIDGYDRERFLHWLDLDDDGCDTRREVLAAESLRPGSGRCGVDGGLWLSVYDDVTTTDPSTFDIDHVLALAEAWHSGANTWHELRRAAFANDLDDPRALIAVTASSNRQKGASDPAEWMPAAAGHHCQYLGDWVAMKFRWGLGVDPRERAAIAAGLGGCQPVPLTVTVT
jgi:hypothetical protein